MSSADDKVIRTPKVILTPDEAISLLPDDGESIHNFVNPRAGRFIGVDFERADAEAQFRAAKQIEIGGYNCKAMKHPLVVWDADGRLSFFTADMAKVEAFEAARAREQHVRANVVVLPDRVLPLARLKALQGDDEPGPEAA